MEFPVNFEMWQIIIGLGLPLVISMIAQPAWSKAAKFWVSFALVCGAAFGDIYFSGALVLTDLGATFLKILFLAFTSYKVFWHPSGIAEGVERTINSGTKRTLSIRGLSMIAVLVFAAFSLTACSGFMAKVRTRTVSWSESDIKNAETIETISQNLMQKWLVWSGLVKGGLGEQFNAILPAAVVAAWNEADEISQLDFENLSEESLIALQARFPGITEARLPEYLKGYYMGIRARIAWKTTARILEQYLPDALQYVPSFLL
jgi:hypothetical protein